MRNFKDLRIWQKGIEIAIDVYSLTSSFPSSEKFGIVSQITRAAVSIASNIAEGSSRTSQKDYKRYIEIALGSSFELETQFLIAKAANLGNAQGIDKLLIKLDEEQKMLTSFINKIRE